MKCNVFNIWEEHQHALERFISIRISNKADSFDILHTVFFKMYRYCERKSDVSNIKAWLYQIAHHCIIDHYKMNSRFTELTADQLMVPPSKKLQDGASKWVQPLLSLLPQKYAEPLKLADIQGFKQEEVANKLGLTLSATKSRIQRGRKKLKNKFNECGVLEIEEDHMNFTVTKTCCKGLIKN